jgi:hypothetical protein
MKKKRRVSVMPMCLLALGLILIGCPTGTPDGSDTTGRDDVTGTWRLTVGTATYYFALGGNGEGYNLYRPNGWAGGMRWVVSGSKVTCGMAFSDNIRPEDVSFTFNVTVSSGPQTVDVTTMAISNFTDWHDGVVDPEPDPWVADMNGVWTLVSLDPDYIVSVYKLSFKLANTAPVITRKL